MTKNYIHARIGKHERALLERLKRLTGMSESEIVRRGLELVARDAQRKSALDLAGSTAGSVDGGPSDLSTNKKYMDGFGE